LDIERFVSEQNIDRYRRLAASAITPTERAKLLGLLAEEQARLTALKKARAAPVRTTPASPSR
jgi:hypothetical protein